MSVFLIFCCEKGLAQAALTLSNGSQYHSETCHFTATFPSTPNSEPPRDANGIKFRAYWSSSNSVLYSIACFVYPPGLKPGGMEFLEQHRDETVNRANGELMSDQATKYQGYPARQFAFTALVQGTKKDSVTRTVVAGQYFYILQVVFSAKDGKQVSAKDIGDFFQTLAIDAN
jgi:hypothetical protein